MLKSTRIWILVLVAVLLVACGGDGEPAVPTASAEKPAVAPTQEATTAPATSTPEAQEPTPAQENAAPQEMTPREIGQAVAARYVEAMTELTDLVEGKPPAAEIKPQVEDLKETYIQKLVELGRKREALSNQERATVDSAISVGINALYGDPVFATYSEVVQYYFNEDPEFHQLLSSFNIITQYASFDLLKQQEPDEAARLGIE